MAADERFADPWIECEKELGFRPLLHGPIDNIFKEWEGIGAVMVAKFAKYFPAPDENVKTEDKKINNGVTIRIYTPRGYTGGKPVFVYIHAGGWAMGDLNMDDAPCRVISKGAGVVLVSVEYRLAPAHKYLVGLDDCVTAYKWALNNVKALNCTPDQAVIGGASAGGGSAFGLALKLIDEGFDKSIGLVAQIPVTIHPDCVPSDLKSKYTSYKEHTDHTVNTESAMRAFFDAYGAAPDNKYVSPLLHPKLEELPKTYISCCGHDTLRDDARLMKEALEKNGVQVKYDEYPGYPHYFWSFPSPALKGPSAKYLENIVEGVKFVLS